MKACADYAVLDIAPGEIGVRLGRLFRAFDTSKLDRRQSRGGKKASLRRHGSLCLNGLGIAKGGRQSVHNFLGRLICVDIANPKRRRVKQVGVVYFYLFSDRRRTGRRRCGRLYVPQKRAGKEDRAQRSMSMRFRQEI